MGSNPRSFAIKFLYFHKINRYHYILVPVAVISLFPNEINTFTFQKMILSYLIFQTFLFKHADTMRCKVLGSISWEITT